MAKSGIYIRDSNDYYTLSTEILEKFHSAIEMLRFHLYYIYDTYYISVNTFWYNTTLKQFWSVGESQKYFYFSETERSNLCDNNSVDFV